MGYVGLSQTRERRSLIMYIAYNKSDKKIIAIRETEWQCRMNAKDVDLVAYNTWLSSITNEEGVITYPSESFEIVKTDETLGYQDKGVTISYSESGHIPFRTEAGHKYGFHLKWDGSKIVKDDDALEAYQTAEKWKRIRGDRNILLADTDYLALKDNTLSASWKEYRQALRDIPSQSDPDKITWPTKPS